MRTLILGALLALALPGAASAAVEAPTPTDLAKAACKTEQHATGTKLFKKTYAVKSAARAREACVAKAVPVAQQETQNAAKACKAERTADPAAFAAKYGTNRNGKNAYGKCVSAKAREAVETATQKRVNAAKTCKALRKDDKAAFDQAYGTKKNAFGKCVSATAKADDA